MDDASVEINYSAMLSFFTLAVLFLDALANTYAMLILSLVSSFTMGDSGPTPKVVQLNIPSRDS